MNQRTKNVQGRGAFSLIEVTMAMALVSVAVITVLGLMPVGMAALHRAMDTTEEAQIVRQISAQVLLTPYSTLPGTFSGATFYFDQDSVLLGSSTAATPVARPEGTHYWANTTVYAPVYPGSANATALAQGLTTVHIVLLSGASANATSTNSYNLQVPNSGN